MRNQTKHATRLIALGIVLLSATLGTGQAIVQSSQDSLEGSTVIGVEACKPEGRAAIFVIPSIGSVDQDCDDVEAEDDTDDDEDDGGD